MTVDMEKLYTVNRLRNLGFGSIEEMLTVLGGERIWWCVLSKSGWGSAKQHENWYVTPDGHEECGWRWLIPEN